MVHSLLKCEFGFRILGSSQEVNDQISYVNSKLRTRYFELIIYKWYVSVFPPGICIDFGLQNIQGLDDLGTGFFRFDDLIHIT